MGRLLYSALASADGYVADRAGGFGWAVPDAEVHAAVNDLQARVGTMLLGRRLFEVLSAWETVPTSVEAPGGAEVAEVERAYAALWRDCDKVVASRTLARQAAQPPTSRTRVVPLLDADRMAALKAGSERDLSIGGPTLAGQALAAGLVDEVHLFTFPVVVGGGLQALPEGVRLDLALRDVRRFASGVVHSAYDVVGR